MNNEIKLDEAKLKRAKAKALKSMAAKAKAAKAEAKKAEKSAPKVKAPKAPKEKKPGIVSELAETIKDVQFGVVYEVKGQFLMNAKAHKSEISARWTEKAIRRTGCPVWTVRMEVLPAVAPVESK